jgi:hypothetical protein
LASETKHAGNKVTLCYCVRKISALGWPTRADFIFISTSVVSDIFCRVLAVWTIKSRRMTWAGHVARMGGSRSVYRILVGKPEGKRPLGRPRRI